MAVNELFVVAVVRATLATRGLLPVWQAEWKNSRLITSRAMSWKLKESKPPAAGLNLTVLMVRMFWPV